MKVAIATGGTGGHCYPAIMVASALQSLTHKVLFMGGTKGFEADLSQKYNIPFASVRAKGFPSKIGYTFITAVISLLLGIKDALKLLSRFKPNIVVGGGGYCSAPAVLAARILGIPILLMEQNLFPGKVTRLFARFAKKILVSFPESKSFLPKIPITVTGTPVRKEITAVSKEEGRKKIGLDPKLFTILVMGASQGAQSINKAMEEISKLKDLNSSWQWIHITGKSHFENVNFAIMSSGPIARGFKYIGFPYLENIADAYAAADLIVTRAGATTIAEILCRGLPAILIPYPYASEDHQLVNAKYLAKEGAAVLLLEKELSGERLIREVTLLANDQELLNRIGRCSKQIGKPDALDMVVKEILTAGGGLPRND